MVATSASQTIFFVASILVALSVVSIFIVSVDQFSQSIEKDSSSLSTKILTSVDFANDPEMVPYNPYKYTAPLADCNITLYLLNTGKSTLAMNQDNIQVYINGTRIPSSGGRTSDHIENISKVTGTSDSWEPGDLISIKVTKISSAYEGVDPAGIVDGTAIGYFSEDVTYRAFVIVTAQESPVTVQAQMDFKVKIDDRLR